jgi:hypothetical protein
MTLRSIAPVPVALAVLVAAGGAAARPPMAQHSAADMNAAPRAASLHLSPNPVHAGAFVRIQGSGGGCPVGDVVKVLSRAFPPTHEFAGVPSANTPIRANGNFRTRVRIPLHRRPGTYQTTARCGGGNFGIAVPLRVLQR